MKTQKMIYAALLFAGLFFLASCQPVDFDGPQLAANNATAVQTYSVSIPAVFDEGALTKAVEFEGENGISHFFKAGEEVHIAVESSDGEIVALAGKPYVGVITYRFSGEHEMLNRFCPAALTPTDISQDGTHCTLTGENLTFYTLDPAGEQVPIGEGGSPLPGKYTVYTPQEGDKFHLYYQAPQDDTYRFGGLSFVGFAQAEDVPMTIEGNTLTPSETVEFENVGSMFRQLLTFKNGEEDVTATVKNKITLFTVEMSNGETIQSYNPFVDDVFYDPYFGYQEYHYGPVVFDADATNYKTDNDGGNVYFSMLFNDDNNDASIILTAYDDEGNAYSCTKSAPGGGFENSKYYYGSMELSYKSTVVIKHADGSITIPIPDGVRYAYEFSTLVEGDTLKLRGDLGMVDFYFYGDYYENWNGNVVFDNVTAEAPYYFINSESQKLNIELKGTSAVKGEANEIFYCNGADLRFSCKKDDSATLSVSSPYTNYRGLWSNYYGSWEQFNTDGIAAPGHIVTLENENPAKVDGYYPFVYTVTNLGDEVDLSTLEGDFTAADGQTLTGELGGNYWIKIADGATVTLDGVTINGSEDNKILWSGISCYGDATLILADDSENIVKSFGNSSAGIFISKYYYYDESNPNTPTLTVRGETGDGKKGNGKLTATSLGGGAGIGADVYIGMCGNIVIEGGVIEANSGDAYLPGIGCGSQSNTNFCGDITITGGNVVATGGAFAPGIGAGNKGECGDITITGGTVVANGGEGASGIGSVGYVYFSTCGEITIGTGITSVTASKRSSACSCIGPGTGNSDCGTIIFGTGNTATIVYENAVWSNTFYYDDAFHPGTYGGLTLTITTTTVDEQDIDTWTLTPVE